MASFSYKNVFDNIATDANTLHQVTVAAVRAAEDIYAEDPATVGHAARKTLATAVVNAPDTYAYRFVLACGVDPTIVAAGNKNLADSDVLNAIKLAWNCLAGA